MKKNARPKRIQLELSPAQFDYVAERAEEYGSVSQFVGALIRKDRADRSVERSHIEALALEGIRSGPALPEDPEFFPALRARIQAKAKLTTRLRSRCSA